MDGFPRLINVRTQPFPSGSRKIFTRSGPHHDGSDPLKRWAAQSVEVKVLSLCCVRHFVAPWTVALQASLSMGFSRQEYWSGLPCPSPVDLPDLGIEPGSPALQADSLPSEPPGKLSCTPVSSLFVLPKGKSRGLAFCNLRQKHLSKKPFRLIKGKDRRQAASNTSFCLLVCCKVKQLLGNDRTYWNKFQHL